MATGKRVFGRRARWVAAVCVLGLLAAAPALANPISIWPTSGHRWLRCIAAGLINLPIDLFLLMVVGWLIGLFRDGIDRPFYWWGAAIWAGGVVADALAGYWLWDRSYPAMVVAAIGLIFAWNLVLAVGPGQVGVRRALILAAAMAVLTAPYFVPQGPNIWGDI